MAEKTCREFEENLDALLTGWYQEEDCTAERAAILNAYATAEQEREELWKEVEDLTRTNSSFNDEIVKLKQEIERLRAAAEAVVKAWSHPFVDYQQMNELKDALERG